MMKLKHFKAAADVAQKFTIVKASTDSAHNLSEQQKAKN